jgi:hypothetical protein
MFCCRRRHPIKTPSSPSLTSDEIQKIKDNLSNITDFNFYTYNNQTSIILQVYTRLYSATKPADPPDSKKDPWASILVDALEIVGIATEQPEIEILAVVVGGVVEYVTDNNDTFKNISGYDLAKDCSSELTRNDSTYYATQKMISLMYDDPNTYRDQELSISGFKSVTLRDLIDITIPNKNMTAFTTATQVHARAFKSNITIEEMAKLQNWELYFIQDNQGDQEGQAFKPHASGINGGVQRSRLLNKDFVGNGVRIVANDEIRFHHPEYVTAEGYGTDDNDVKKSWLDANNSFINQFPAAITYPWTATNVSVYSCRFYIVEGLNKLSDGSTNTPIANGDFMRWLFIDDGFGNIVNTDGVMYRYDFLTSGITINGDYVPGSNMFPISESVEFKSSDDQYRYPGKNVNEKVKIYVGDLEKEEIVEDEDEEEEKEEEEEDEEEEEEENEEEEEDEENEDKKDEEEEEDKEKNERCKYCCKCNQYYICNCNCTCTKEVNEEKEKEEMEQKFFQININTLKIF